MALKSATALPARLARTPDDYARIGIEPRAIKLTEDGMRTDGSQGTYECGTSMRTWTMVRSSSWSS